MTENRAEEKKTGCLLIHGFTGTPWVFTELKIRLMQNNFEVSVPLLPGHGSSIEDLATRNWYEWIECAKQEYDTLKKTCSRVVLIGLSVGGAIALHLSSQCNCDGIITMSTPIKLNKPKLLLIPFLRPFKQNWKKRTNIDQKFPEEAGYDSYPLAGIQQCRRLLRVVGSNLKEISCPALILHARGDKRISEKNSKVIYRRIASRFKKVILYPNPCHTLIKGKDALQVENDIIDFLNLVRKEQVLTEHSF